LLANREISEHNHYFNSNPAVKVIRRTLEEIEENGELKDDKKLVM
jgi:hypothetical protein